MCVERWVTTGDIVGAITRFRIVAGVRQSLGATAAAWRQVALDDRMATNAGDVRDLIAGAEAELKIPAAERLRPQSVCRDGR
jgi:hypothetical protein